MSISDIYILDLLGKPLISRSYRKLHDVNVIDNFKMALVEKEEDNCVTPVFQIDKVTVAFIKHKNIYLVATTINNSNIALVFVFLHKMIHVMTDYFKELEEESIKDNIVVMYELLDEVLDFGYPQSTESKILMEYIMQESKTLAEDRRIPPAVTNAVSWRSEGITYKKNELFLDVIESIDLLGSSNGAVVCSEITGSIKIRAYLSGMPQIHLGLNDKLAQKDARDYRNSFDLEEVKFHQCVRLCQFEIDRNISFIPPDGEFELMSYRLNTYVKPPIWVNCVAEYYPHSKVEFSVKLTSHFKSRFMASDVKVLIPVHSDVDTPKFNAGFGVVSYVPEGNVIKWYLKTLPGNKEYFMTARFGLPSVTSSEQEQLPPIIVEFDISLFNISGVHVQYLKVVEKSGYMALPWVRYSTKNGGYHIRCKEVIHNRQLNR